MICRACGSKLTHTVHDFGAMALANDFCTVEESMRYDDFHPLTLRMCERCSLLQLGHVVPKERLYKDYPYVTSQSDTMTEHLECMVRNISDRVRKSRGWRVLEIGSNVGTFLAEFSKLKGCPVLGFEPAKHLAKEAIDHGIPTIAEFFTKQNARNVSRWKPDVIVGRHVLAHIDDWQDLVEALNVVCHEATVIVFEFPYALDIYQGIQFDTVYHEHLSYITLKSVIEWLEDTPFMVSDVQRCNIHGGSLIVYIKTRSRRRHRSPIVSHLLATEAAANIWLPESWEDWSNAVGELRDDLMAVVHGALTMGHTVGGYGASAKGNTLLQYCGFNADMIHCVSDTTPQKQGKLTPGSWIKVVTPSEFQAKPPDYALMLAWNFQREIMEKNGWFSARGGKWIIPIPRADVV